MLRVKQPIDAALPAPLTAWLGGSRRQVNVRVVVRGHEVDSFDASSPRSLSLVLRPILKHLPAHDARIEFVGLRTTWGPFGLRRRAESTPLNGASGAMAFLGDAWTAETPPAAERRRVGFARDARGFRPMAAIWAHSRPRFRRVDRAPSRR